MKKILLVDDEEYIRRFYVEELSEEGYEVVTAASGHNLLRKINLFQPGLVILDIKLMDYDGLELLQEIRTPPPRFARHFVYCLRHLQRRSKSSCG